MDTMKCSACGKEIPSDATRCTFCGQIQGFSSQKIDGGLKPRESNIAPALPTNPEEPAEKIQEKEYNRDEQIDQGSQDSQKPELPIEGRKSRLKTILTGKDMAADLDSLRQEGLLPDEEIIPESAGLPTSFPQQPISADLSGTNNLPEWLRNSGFNPLGDTSRTDEETDAQGELAATMGEIPDWVRRLQEKIERREEKQPEKESELTPSVPVEVISFPLADAMKRRRATPKVEVQEADAGLIESVTTYIGGLKTPRKNHTDVNRRLSRSVWGVIGLAMFSLAAAMLWSGSSVAGSSQPAVAGMAEMTTRIDAMPPESVVLIGMDYDLSLAGEINNVALPVLVHLMSKEVSLIFVSMRPTGSAMAKLLIDMGKNWLPEYPNQKTFVFPYIPGGATGLLQLASDPRDALPFDVDGTYPWLIRELTNIREISDFSSVLLLTDSANSGRDWIEQVRPRMADRPLYVITSRQAGPILMPYQESGQIQAMITGISDGASYERVHLFTTNNQQMIKAYHGVLLFMAVLIACVLVLSVFPQNPRIKSRKASHTHAAR